jgi:hypothetical protein
MQATRRARNLSPEVDPIGSEGWALDWRNEVRTLLAQGNRPERLATFMKLGNRWRVWALLKRRDGSHFRSLDELCAAPAPFGLGCDRGALASRSAAPASSRPRRPSAGPKAPARAAPKAKAKRPAPRGKAAAAALGLPERVERRLTLLRRDVAEALARGEFASVAAAARAARRRRGPDPVAKILAAAAKLSEFDRVRLAVKLVEVGLFAKR